MKILLILLLSIASLMAFETKPKYEGKFLWTLQDKKVYTACLNGITYYLVDTVYQSSLSPKFIEIDHSIMGKILQPEKCSK